MGPEGMLVGGFGFGWSESVITTLDLVSGVRFKMTFYLAYNILYVVSC